MGRPRSHRPRNKYVIIRLNEAEDRLLRDGAAAAAMPMSDWLRVLIRGATGSLPGQQPRRLVATG
jgi:hypothetical protein